MLGLGSHPVDGRNIVNQLRLGSVSHYLQGSVKNPRW